MESLNTWTFEQIVQDYGRRVRVICERILGRRGEAEEAAQDALLKAYQAWDRFEGDPGPWLYRIAVNTCIDRKRAPRPAGELPEVADRRPDPARLAEIGERWRRVQAALRQLPERERAAITLRDIEGLETREVAELLGCAEVTVRTHIAAARMKLRRILGEGKR